MAYRASVRSSARIQHTARLLLIPAVVAALAVACSDSAPTSKLGTDGVAGQGGGGKSTGGTANNVAGSNVSGSLSTSGSSGASSVTGGSVGSGGTVGGGGVASAGGAAGTAGTNAVSGSAGTASSGGTAPTCSVPASGGVDFSGLLGGPVSVEGEAAQLAGAAAVAAEGSGWSGTGFADMKAAEGSMTWLIDVPASGSYSLDWSYAQSDTRDMRLSVNCSVIAESVPFEDTGSWNAVWQMGGAQTVTLNKGTNQIVLETNGGSGPNFDTMQVSPPTCAIGDAATTCEAERAMLTGAAALASEGSGWKDLGFADMLGAEGAVNWLLDAPYAGTYTLSFVYAQDDARDMTVLVNGVVAAQSLPFNNTGSWNTNWAVDVTPAVELKKGPNSLQLATNGESGPNFDSVIVLGLGDGAGGAGGVSGAGGAP